LLSWHHPFNGTQIYADKRRSFFLLRRFKVHLRML